MGLRCLLGHDFDEPELRREREEDGNEVVTTVTEVKTCARCGETQVVSENTEVTTMEQLTDEAAAGAETARAGPTPGVDDGRGATGDVGGDAVSMDAAATGDGATGDEASEAGPTADATDDIDDVDDAVIIDDGPAAAADDRPEDGTAGADDGPADAADEGDEPADEDAELLESDPDGEAGSLGGGDEYAEYPEVETAESTEGDERDAATDDGVILDEGDEPAADRERGAWPEVDEADEPEPSTTAWPEQRGEDEGFSAEVGDGGAGGVEFGGGLTPEAAESTGEDGDAEYVEAPERDADEVGGAVEPRGEEAEPADAGTGITRAESPDLSTSTSETTTEYHCPECGMTRDADGNSMRAGDICPECKRGYVTERPT